MENELIVSQPCGARGYTSDDVFAPPPMLIYCAECGDEPVDATNQVCGYCTSEANDIAALNLLRSVVVGVEVGCAVYVLNRAQRHIVRGRYRVDELKSLAIAVLMEVA